MHVAILGNGITGVTAALTLRRLRPDWRITMVSGESTYPFSRPALMYVFMGHMGYAETKLHEDRVWIEQRIDLLRGWVARIDTQSRRLEFTDGRKLAFDKLLVATGAQPNKFGWPGQDLAGVQGFYSLMDLKTLIDASATTRRAVVVGGGLIGLELAEMLHSRGIPVTLLVREPSYWSNVLPPEESQLVNEEIARAGLDLRLGAELAEIVDDGTGRAGAVVTKAGERIECELVGLTAGVSPNKAVAEASGIPCARGVRVDAGLRTEFDGIWAAGDCAELAGGKVEQVWYTGKAQGELAARSIAGEDVAYAPGIWFNSAKFVDLEYQTYGVVPADGSASLVASIEGPVQGKGRNRSGDRLLRLAFDGARLVGVNAMGVRLRHRVVEGWLRAGLDVGDAIARLGDAAFDPEFFEPLTKRLGPDLAQKWRDASPLEVAR